jgi:hypothetical protein
MPVISVIFFIQIILTKEMESYYEGKRLCNAGQ